MFDDPQKAAEGVKLIIESVILAASFIDFKKNPKLKKDSFLLYDTDFLVERYKSEHPIATGIPLYENSYFC